MYYFAVKLQDTMKELLLQYAEYNVWANKKIIDALLALGEPGVDQVMASSFPTIRKTVHHTMAAEHTWLQRLQLVEHPVWVGNDFTGSFEDACSFWGNASKDMLAFVAACHTDAISASSHYKDRSGNAYETPVNEILHHVFNHSTYHRGQLVTMMRTCGVTEIPGTDFIGFVRL
ncbi:MAG: DinB family protein [Flavipsychrobacter sp.]|nr:DinB family protein [Flavipsychrobacter sp.]